MTMMTSPFCLYRCDNSHDNSQLTLSHLNTTFPEVRLISNASGQIPVDHCQLHPNITDVPGIAAAVDTESDRCLKWQYSQERYTSTIVSEVRSYIVTT